MRAMKMLRRLGLPLALFATSAFAQTTPSPYDTVDPFIGTGGEGHTFPGAVAPFGMVQLSPDTDTTCTIRDCYDHAAGYRYDDTTISSEENTSELQSLMRISYAVFCLKKKNKKKNTIQ